MPLFVSLELLPGLFTMKSFQVVIVTILFMALLMISEARKGKCKKRELRHTYCEQFCMMCHCWSEHDVERHLVKKKMCFLVFQQNLPYRRKFPILRNFNQFTGSLIWLSNLDYLVKDGRSIMWLQNKRCKIHITFRHCVTGLQNKKFRTR